MKISKILKQKRKKQKAQKENIAIENKEDITKFSREEKIHQNQH